MKPLIEFKKNVYSQSGEDGVIEEILQRLNITQGNFVEFGAWDGMYLSNTFNLLKNKNWKGLYIESDSKRFLDLQTNMRPYGENIKCVNAFVEVSGDNSLDNILTRAKFKKDFELLSIDIDSYDFHIWESLKKFSPKIVIIEVDAFIPPGTHYIFNESNQKITYNIGDGLYNVTYTSFSSMVILGKNKGYTPIYSHSANVFFVKNELLPKLKIPTLNINYPETVFTNNIISYRHFAIPITIGSVISKILLFLNSFFLTKYFLKLIIKILRLK